jgi:hypothetical protein
MKNFSVIELYSTLPDTDVEGNINFTNYVKRYNDSFNITQLLPTDYQEKIYGWNTHLNLSLTSVSVFFIVNPIHNFILIKHFFKEFEKLNQYGFNFEAVNVNINPTEYERIFYGEEKETVETVKLDLELTDMFVHL